MSGRKKKAYRNKNFCVYFTHLPRSPPWRNLHKILHDGSPPWRNQPCQILSQSGQGFWFCGGSNFWIPHKKEKLPLTQGLNYRSACDGYFKQQHGNCYLQTERLEYVDFAYRAATVFNQPWINARLVKYMPAAHIQPASVCTIHTGSLTPPIHPTTDSILRLMTD